VRILLASISPRRREIFSLLGVPFDVVPPRYQEVSDARRSPEHEALHFAREKALSLAEDFSDALIVGSDTIVALGETKLGKPSDAEDATTMLRLLSGKTHRVLTGVAVVDAQTGAIRDTVRESLVRMKAMPDLEIEEYVATGEPLDKAGAYAVQGLGGRFITSVEGDYFNVVGLPLRDLALILGHFGIKITSDIQKIYQRQKGSL
jgi:septum formation protein